MRPTLREVGAGAWEMSVGGGVRRGGGETGALEGTEVGVEALDIFGRLRDGEGLEVGLLVEVGRLRFSVVVEDADGLGASLLMLDCSFFQLLESSMPGMLRREAYTSCFVVRGCGRSDLQDAKISTTDQVFTGRISEVEKQKPTLSAK